MSSDITNYGEHFMSTLRVAGSLVGLVLAGCDSRPPPAVPPHKPVPLQTDRYADATLLIEGIDPANEPVVLENGREYHYSGRFRLANPERESPRLARLVAVQFLVDLEQSGYNRVDSQAGDRAPHEVIVGQDINPTVTVDKNGVVHFEGLIEAPRKSVGEVEMRLSVTDTEENRRLAVASRRVQVVEANASDE